MRFIDARPQALVAEVPAAAAMFKRASEILRYDLLQVCSEGPKEKLDLTAVRRASAARAEGCRASRFSLTAAACLRLPGQPARHLRLLAGGGGEAEGARPARCAAQQRFATHGQRVGTHFAAPNLRPR
jgi:hypothetical protein